MAKAKAKQPSEVFEELVVKLKNIYKDLYIFRDRFCIPGEETPDSIVGDVECILEPQYEEAVKLLFPKVECLYVPSVGDLRETLREYNSDPGLAMQYEENTTEMRNNGENVYFIGKVVEKPSKTETCLKFVTRFEKMFQNISRTWTCIGDNEELVNVIYNNKSIFNLPIEESKTKDGKVEYITVAKQLLPLVTEKNISNAFLNIKKSEDHDGLYEVLIDFHFTHFRIWGFYNIIPLPFL